MCRASRASSPCPFRAVARGCSAVRPTRAVCPRASTCGSGPDSSAICEGAAGRASGGSASLCSLCAGASGTRRARSTRASSAVISKNSWRVLTRRAARSVWMALSHAKGSATSVAHTNGVRARRTPRVTGVGLVEPLVWVASSRADLDDALHRGSREGVHPSGHSAYAPLRAQFRPFSLLGALVSSFSF